MSLIYFAAFLSLFIQARGLWGSQGILPISNYVGLAESQLGSSRFFTLPSFFYFVSTDWAVVGFAGFGMVTALLALTGFAQGWMLLLCYLLYLSYTSMGQDFLSFQWDTLLLEVGFLTMFAVPWKLGFQPWAAVEPQWWVRWIFLLVIGKLMWLSGLAKILSGDDSWRDLTALTYHYWTQPIPNFAAPFVHALPVWLHKVSTAMMFVIEIVFPALIFFPRTRVVAGLGFIFLNLLILLSGNYAFFNWLTIILCFWLLPGSWFQWNILDKVEVVSGPHMYVSAPLMVWLAVLSFFWLTRFFMPDGIQSFLRPLVRATAGWSPSNGYGLFASMTKDRGEIVIEGSNDGNNWLEYEFKYKPGSLKRIPPWIAPHQPRLDWQMWFAALGRFQDSPWLDDFMMRIQEGSPDVLSLLKRNPFPEEPPQFLRAQLYRYEFNSPVQIVSSGDWWRRTFLGHFSPVFKKP